MNSFLYLIKREFSLLFYNKSMFFFSVILPFVSIVFFNTLLSNPVARDLPIAVVDLDNSSISRGIISQLDATPELKVAFKPVSQLEGEQLIKELKVYGIVTIPSKFGSNLKQGKQTQILNQFNSNLLLPSGLENKAFLKTVGTISAGVNIQKQLAKGTNLHQAKANFQPVKPENHVLSNPYTNYSYYLNSGFLTMFFQMFVLLTTIYCFGTDLKYNKGEKIYAIGNKNIHTIVLAKILPYTLWFVFVGLVMYYSMFMFQGFPFNGSKLVVILALILLILASQAFAIFIVSISRSFREALTFGSSFAAISLSFSGITYPIFGMPKVLQWVSQVFPFTHFFEVFIDQTQRGIPIIYSVKQLLALAVIIIIVPLLSFRSLRKLFNRGAFKNNI